MPYTDAVRNGALDYAATQGSWISLHLGDPGSTGASECSGGSYARIQTTWGTSSAGIKTGSAITLTPQGTALYWGLWSAATGGTFCGGWALTSAQASQFQFTPSLTD